MKALPATRPSLAVLLGAILLAFGQTGAAFAAQARPAPDSGSKRVPSDSTPESTAPAFSSSSWPLSSPFRPDGAAVPTAGSGLGAVVKFGESGVLRIVVPFPMIYDVPGSTLGVALANDGSEFFVLDKKDVWEATTKSGERVKLERKKERFEADSVAPRSSLTIRLAARAHRALEFREVVLRSRRLGTTVSVQEPYVPPRTTAEVPPMLTSGIEDSSVGMITVTIEVGADGRADAIVPDQQEAPGSPRGRWLEAVYAAVTKWEFAPATIGGIPRRGSMRESFPLTSQRLVTRVFRGALREVLPRVEGVLKEMFPLVLPIPSSPGFVAASRPGEGNSGDRGVNALLIRAGEQMEGTWLAVTALRFFDHKNPHVNGCTCGFWDYPLEVPEGLMDLIVARLELKALAAATFVPHGDDVLIPSGRAEEGSKGKWQRMGLRHLMRAVLDAPINKDGVAATPALSECPTERDILHVEPEPLLVAGEVKAPVLIKKVVPDYPDAARAARKQGNVILEAVIDTEGNVQDTRLLRSIPGLDRAALEAVCCWKYKPAMRNGKPVTVYFTVVITFSL
jgi:TonB family protein